MSDFEITLFISDFDLRIGWIHLLLLMIWEKEKQGPEIFFDIRY